MANSGKNQCREAREFQTPSSGIFFKAGRIHFEGKSDFQNIQVIRNATYGNVLLLDGLVQTTEKDEFFYHEMLVHPACASHPSPRNVLIIGGGDGGALREVLRYRVTSAKMVEIDARVIEVCKKHFPWLRADLKDKRAQIIIGDGNAYVRETGEKFDVILVDSSDPVGPSAVLHEKAFYTRLKNCLAPRGIIAAQAGSQLFHVDHHAAKMVFLKKMFKHAHIYSGPVPTYPGGTWCYVFLSDAVDPLRSRSLRLPDGLKYLNPETFKAAFALPQFMKERLKA